MMSMFVAGVAGGLVAAYFAWPYGWLAAAGAYAIGGALCALVPAWIGWRREATRERDRIDGVKRKPAVREDCHHG